MPPKKQNNQPKVPKKSLANMTERDFFQMRADGKITQEELEILVDCPIEGKRRSLLAVILKER